MRESEVQTTLFFEAFHQTMKRYDLDAIFIRRIVGRRGTTHRAPRRSCMVTTLLHGHFCKKCCSLLCESC